MNRFECLFFVILLCLLMNSMLNLLSVFVVCYVWLYLVWCVVLCSSSVLFVWVGVKLWVDVSIMLIGFVGSGLSGVVMILIVLFFVSVSFIWYVLLLLSVV